MNEKGNFSPVKIKQYGAVDIMRMIMAICVLFIHRGYVMDNESAYFVIRNYVCETAVPFFVCTTSFFLYKKLIATETDRQGEIIKKYLVHLLLIFVIWSAVYFPVAIFKECFVNGETWSAFIKNYLYKAVAGGETFLHLWYIQALIIASLMIYLLQKKISTKHLLVIFWVLYFFYFFAMKSENQTVSDLYNKIPPAIFNYLCRISVYIVLGKFIAENQRLESNLKKSSIGLGVSVLVSTIFFLLRYKNECIGTVLQMAVMPVVVMFLFSVCINVDFSFRNQGDFRKVTELFYFVHLIIPVELYDIIFSKLGRVNLAYNCGFIMAFYFVFSVLLSFIVLKLSKTKRLKFLKYLY